MAENEGAVSPDKLLTVDMETAQEEFDRLCESWNLSTEYDSEDKESVRSILQYIQKGVLVVKSGKGDKLVVQHNLHEPLTKDRGMHEITYKYIITEDIMSLDNIDSKKSFAQNVELIYALSGTQRNLVKRMAIKDLSIGGAIGALFLVY